MLGTLLFRVPLDVPLCFVSLLFAVCLSTFYSCLSSTQNLRLILQDLGEKLIALIVKT